MDFPTPKEIEATQARMKARGEEARLMSDDSDPLVVGSFYTVSRSFDTGDGSWIDDFWEVLTINGPKVFVRIHSYRPIERFTEANGRAWYNADDAWAARTPEKIEEE